MEFLKVVGAMEPKYQQALLQAYMSGDKAFFMSGYVIG
jgi:hypothetical protein